MRSRRPDGRSRVRWVVRGVAVGLLGLIAFGLTAYLQAFLALDPDSKQRRYLIMSDEARREGSSARRLQQPRSVKRSPVRPPLRVMQPVEHPPAA